MSVESNWIDQLLDLPNRAQRRERLRTDFQFHDPEKAHGLAQLLKERVIQQLISDCPSAIRCAELALDLGYLTEKEPLIALGMRLVAQTRLICLADSKTARDYYDQAIALYEVIGDELGRAETALTHIWALANEGDYQAAVQEGNWAFEVFERLGEVRSLGTLLYNLAYIHHREGRMMESYELNERARRFYEALGDDGEILLTSSEIARGGLLHDLGRYAESIRCFEQCLKRAAALRNRVLIARTRQALAFTYHVLGWYNRALNLLELAREGWVQDQREHEVHRADYLIGRCLLRLRRFNEAIPIFQRVRAYFEEQGAEYELGRMHLFEAVAEIEVGDIDSALKSLHQGKAVFIKINNRHEAARADMFAALLQFRMTNWQECIQLSLNSRTVFKKDGARVDAAAATLQAGRASFQIGDYAKAEEFALEAFRFTQPRELTALNYQIDYLLGKIALSEDQPEEAIDHFRRAVVALEELQSRMMVEYRPDYLEDEEKTDLFKTVISLSLERDNVREAWRFGQRAKSRALFDMLDNRIDLQIRAGSTADEPLVDDFNRLLLDRNALRRQIDRARDELDDPAGLTHEMNKIEILEDEIQELRSRLLVRQVDYMEQFKGPTIQEVEQKLLQISEETVILDFYILDDHPILFLVYRSGESLWIQVEKLQAPIATGQNTYAALRTNMSAVAYGTDRHHAALSKQANSLLAQFHDLLLGPVADRLRKFKHLIIAPYGLLHYFPFHAFYDGDRYLIEKFQISYLPSASFWEPPGSGQAAAINPVTVGFSNNGRLPHSIDEARAVSNLFGTEPILEGAATLETVQEALGSSTLFHCASHAIFRPDSPLFSGIELSDGSLTTLDVFNLKMETSLVTLSACSTGMNVIGGGDELLGFIRAFLTAGASSLLLSHWEVDDRSTSLLMQRFYKGLQTGMTKSAALQAAQRAFIDGEASGDQGNYRHPFYWAPFYLVGYAGKL